MGSTEFWNGRRVLVTGGAGFLGSFVTERLRRTGCSELVAPRSREWNLVEQDSVRRLVREVRPHVIIHLAATVGGIGANQKNPGSFFYENLMMGSHLIEAARLSGVAKFVQIGTACSYPKDAALPLREDDLWNGYPEATNAAYGIAKKAILVQLQAYRRQYGLDGIYLLPANLYGPGDNFDLESGHAVPALIRKCVEAKESGAATMTVWGTGRATREFLYVDDCVDAILLATARYAGTEPVNIGNGQEVPIRGLVDCIAREVGFTGAVEFDTSRPDGQARRVFDVTRAADLFGFRARVELEEGIRRTVEWLLANRREAPPKHAIR